MPETVEDNTLAVHPATAERWDELKALFGERGACGGCWCMWWRKPRSQFERDKGAPNRADLRKLLTGDQPPGLLGFLAGAPVAWIAVAPRSAYPVAARSRVMSLPREVVMSRAVSNQAQHDQADIWLVSCLFVRRDRRRRGIATEMVRHAVAYAGTRGAWAVDGVPVEPKSEGLPDAFVWTGLPANFEAAGFVEVARPGPHRPLFRYQIDRTAPRD